MGGWLPHGSYPRIAVPDLPLACVEVRVALPTVTDLKDYLRIETNAENTLLAALLARATAQLELWIDCPITAVSQTYVDACATIADVPVTSIVFPRRPLSLIHI